MGGGGGKAGTSSASLGTVEPPTGNLLGDIMAIYDRIVTAGERTSLREYVQHHYGV